MRLAAGMDKTELCPAGGWAPQPSLRRLSFMLQRDATEIARLLEEIGRRASFEAATAQRRRPMCGRRPVCAAFRGPWKSCRKGSLERTPGVGAAIAKRAETLSRGQADETLERMRRKLPSWLLEPPPAPAARLPARWVLAPRSNAISCRASP